MDWVYFYYYPHPSTKFWKYSRPRCFLESISMDENPVDSDAAWRSFVHLRSCITVIKIWNCKLFLISAITLHAGQNALWVFVTGFSSIYWRSPPIEIWTFSLRVSPVDDIYCCQTIVKFLKRLDKEFFGRLNGWPTVIIQCSESLVTRLFIKVIPAMLSKVFRLAGVRWSAMQSSDMLPGFFVFSRLHISPFLLFMVLELQIMKSFFHGCGWPVESNWCLLQHPSFGYVQTK